MEGWFVKQNLGYITENVFGTVINSNPAPRFDGKSSNNAEIEQMLRNVPKFRNTEDFNE